VSPDVLVDGETKVGDRQTYASAKSWTALPRIVPDSDERTKEDDGSFFNYISGSPPFKYVPDSNGGTTVVAGILPNSILGRTPFITVFT
jgi:hypothetical protein